MEHAWKAGANGTESCARQGCVIIRYAEGGVWQRKKGGHWRRVASEAIPECNGADAAKPAPTVFDKVRWALWHLRDGQHVDVVGVGKALDGLAAFAALERIMPHLMDAYHDANHPKEHGLTWTRCDACAEILESK